MGALSFLYAVASNPWLIATALLAAYLAHKIWQYRRLAHFPGPPGVGFLDSIHSRAFLSYKCHEWYGQVTETYGPIARIAPNVLITSSADVWQHIGGVRSHYTRAYWYYSATRIEAGRDHIISETNNEQHERRRKQMAAGYSGKENVHLEADIDARVSEFIKLLSTRYLSTRDCIKPMDLAAKVQYLTLDVISTLALGQSLGMLTTDADPYGYIQSGKEGLWACNLSVGMGFNWLLQFPSIGRLVLPSEKDKTGFGNMIGTAFAKIDARLSRTDSSAGRSDMLGSFVKNGLAGAELKSEVLEVILAGSDTTAAGIRAIMLYIITSPRVCKKLQDEIDHVILEKWRDAASAVVPDSVVRSMPYLQAVIKEGLRVFPPVSNLFPRVAPPEGDTINVNGKSYFIPGGTSVGYSAWGMHHDQALYGEDADVFRPERWLNEDVSRLKEMNRVNDLIFGYGRWKCLGMQVGLTEISKTLFEVFRQFDMALVDPANPWVAHNYMGLFNISDMWVEVRARGSR